MTASPKGKCHIPTKWERGPYGENTDVFSWLVFGSLSAKKRKTRKGCNPQTGEAIKIAVKKVLTFSAGAGLKKAVK